MSKPTPAGYRPSGGQCAQCKHAARDCSALDFATMRPAGKRDADGVQRVACSGYVRADHVGDVNKMVKPCRCGPEGCADSRCPGRRAADFEALGIWQNQPGDERLHPSATWRADVARKLAEIFPAHIVVDPATGREG